MTKHDPTPAHTLADRIAATLYALEANLPLPQLSAAERGLASAWVLTGMLHFYAERPALAPMPLAMMHLDAVSVLSNLQEIATYYKVEVPA